MRRTISVSTLKEQLSHYIREIQRGGEFQVVLRGKPVARLVGVHGLEGRGRERRTRLVAAGALRPGAGRISEVLDSEPIELDGVSLRKAISEDRDDRG